MTPWIVIGAVGLGSYLFRLSMVLLVDRIRMPSQLDRASGLVAPQSVLVATWLAFALAVAGGIYLATVAGWIIIVIRETNPSPSGFSSTAKSGNSTPTSTPSPTATITAM